MTKKLLVTIFAFILSVALFPLMPGAGGSSYAATSGSASSIVNYAKSVSGYSKSKLGISGEWCAAFVYHCAKKSGSKSKIGSNGLVITQAEQTVNNKGGKITFVKEDAYKSDKVYFKSSRCTYNHNYKPKPGDLAIFNWYGKKYSSLRSYKGHIQFSHVGIVKSANNTFDIRTYEGNTCCDCGKHKDYNNVEYKHRKSNRGKDTNSNSFVNIVAYVTPNYVKPTTTAVSHKIEYSANGGSDAPASVTVKDGQKFTLSTTKPTRSGYTFKGWYAYRIADSKYFVTGQGWLTQSEINSKGYSKKLYNAGKSFTMDSSWTKGSTKSNYRFYAVWGKLVSDSDYKNYYSDSSKYSAVKYYRYKTKGTITVTNGYPSYSGYTMQKKTQIDKTYGRWVVDQPSKSTTNGSSYQTVVTSESAKAYVTYGYYTDNKQKCWKNTNGGYYPNLLKLYSSINPSKSGYKKDGDGSYILPRTLSISSPGKLGKIYRFSYKGSYATSFTAGSNLGHIYVWPHSDGTKTLYRAVTTKYQYTHSKYNDTWSDWSSWTPEYKENSDYVKRDTNVMYYVTEK